MWRISIARRASVSSNGTGSRDLSTGKKPGKRSSVACGYQSRTVLRGAYARRELLRSRLAPAEQRKLEGGAGALRLPLEVVEPLLLQALLELRHDHEEDHRERGGRDEEEDEGER